MWVIGLLTLVMFVKTVNMSLQIESPRPPHIFPSDYNKLEPPGTEGSPAKVYIQINVMEIDKIYDEAMAFSIQSYFVELWTDYRLNLSVFQRTSELHILPEDLENQTWVPDLVFDNTRVCILFQLSLPNTSLKVLKDGSFMKSSRYNFLVGCHMNFRLYPMDTQHCSLKISTMSNHDDKVQLNWVEDHPKKLKSIQFMNNIKHLRYFILQPEPYKATQIWKRENFTYLYANFTFVRRLSGTVFRVYIPSTLVVLLSWISFWLDPGDVPARVTLGVTSLLTLVTQMVQAQSQLPSVSYMTALHAWFFACLFTVFSSLIEFSVAYRVSIKQPLIEESAENEKNNNAVQKRQMSRVFRSRLHHMSSRNMHRDADQKINSEKPPLFRRKSLDRTSRIIFPALFLLYAVVYWVYFLYFT